MYSRKQHYNDTEVERQETKTLKCLCYAAYNGGKDYEDRNAPANGQVTFRFTTENEPQFFETKIVAPIGTYEVGKVYELPTQRVKYKRAPIPVHDETYWAIEVIEK